MVNYPTGDKSDYGKSRLERLNKIGNLKVPEEEKEGKIGHNKQGR